MGDDPRFPHTRVPNFLSRENYPGLTTSIVCTYLAARRFAYFKSKANERFARCWPSMSTIGEVFGQSRDTVKRNLRWLEENDLIYRRPRGFGKSWVITFVDYPERFRETCAAQGREAAKQEIEDELEEIIRESQVERAVDARERRDLAKRIAHGKWERGASVPSQGCMGAPGGVQMEAGGVRACPPKNKDLKNEDLENKDTEEHDVSANPLTLPQPLSFAETLARTPFTERGTEKDSASFPKRIGLSSPEFDRKLYERIKRECEERDRAYREREASRESEPDQSGSKK